MAGRITWRRLSFLIATVVVVFSALFQTFPAAAAANGTLYGFAGVGNVVTVDPISGVLTTVATVPFGTNVQGFGSGLVNDAATHRLFMVQNVYVDQTVFPFVTASRIITIDPKTHIVTNSPNLASSLVDLAFDPSSKALIGLTVGNQLVHVDATTGAIAPLATLPGTRFSRMAVTPAAIHSLYLASITFNVFPITPTVVMLTVDTLTGAISPGSTLTTGVIFLSYDTSSKSLIGKSFCCPANLMRIDPGTGAETVIKAGLGLGSGFAVDPGSHTVFLTDDELGAFGFSQFIQSINETTGAASLSPALPSNMYVNSLVFEPAPPAPTGCDQQGQNSGDFQCQQSN